MAGKLIDCCSLLNLYTGWSGLAELGDLPGPWYVARSVCGEAEYVREYGAKGSIITKALNLDESFTSRILTSLSAETEQELADYIDLATELDDGEAESMAIAKNRDLVLVTDDRKATRIAQRSATATISTVAVLTEWGELDAANQRRLPEVVKRIRELARFQPAPDSPDNVCWASMTGRTDP